MSTRSRRFLVALALGTSAAFISVGCIGDTAGPVVSTSSRGARTAPALADNSGLTLGSILDPLVRLIFKFVNINGLLGGTVANGRWRLDVPAGAIAGSATVGIGVPSASSFGCQLEILPASMNHFSTPVRLTANCRDIDRDQLKDWVIWWFDPAAKKWVQVQGSSVDLTRGTVSAPLPHFSAYAVGPRDGKAGW